MMLRSVTGKTILACFMVIVLWTGSAAAQDNSVSGRSFTAFFYSAAFPDPSTIVTFEENGILLIDSFEGFGLYLPLGNSFTAIFSAPNYTNETDPDDQDNLFLVMTGVVVSDFLSGGGVAFVNGRFFQFFIFSGYAQ